MFYYARLGRIFLINVKVLVHAISKGIGGFMFKLRDVVIFLAGAAFLHTLSHIVFPFFVPLPLDLKFMVWTPAYNVWTIVISAIVTVALLWWAAKLK